MAGVATFRDAPGGRDGRSRRAERDRAEAVTREYGRFSRCVFSVSLARTRASAHPRVARLTRLQLDGFVFRAPFLPEDGAPLLPNVVVLGGGLPRPRLDRHRAGERQRLFHDHELDGARQQLVGTLRYRSPPPRGPVSNSRSWSHSVNTSGLYSSLSSPNRARSASPARSTSVSSEILRVRDHRGPAGRRRRAPPSRRAPRPPPRPRTSGPTARLGTRPGRSSASTCRRSCPPDAGGAGGGGPPGTARTPTATYRADRGGGFAAANATGLVPGRCVNHACVGSFETFFVSSRTASSAAGGDSGGRPSPRRRPRPRASPKPRRFHPPGRDLALRSSKGSARLSAETAARDTTR